VTGSTGLIGSRIVDRLAAEYRVVGMDLKPPMEDAAAADWLECDLTDPGSVSRALAEMKSRHGDRIASVIHLAAYYDFSGEPSDLYQELTVEGTRRLLKSLAGFHVEQFIFSSSLLVMQPADEGEQITEQSPTAGAWYYPQSMLAAEEVIRNEHGPIAALILRLAGVYDETGHSIPIAQQIARIYEKKLESYFFPGDANHGQAFVHLDDLIECFVAAVARRHELGSLETLLIAEPDVMSYAELQDRIGESLHGREWPTIRIPKAVAKVGAWAQGQIASQDDPTFIKPWMVDLADMHYPVAIDKARQRLGWEPRHRLRSTLEAILSHLKNDPAGWYKANGLPLPDEIDDQ
jgi:nucleoside-diphosphate-sugar epimerase